MSSDQLQGEAVEVLQDLGLKEYEAKCFVVLSRLPKATAKDISEHSDVPRTRVYDAIRVLEAKGLVEVQHSNPQQFRAVSIDEAVTSLEQQYESRMGTLRQALEGMEPAEHGREETAQEVWALTGSEVISNRTRRLIEEATQEVVMVIGAEAVLTDGLLDTLDGVSNDVNVVLGTVSDATLGRITEAVPDAQVYVSGLEWLDGRDGEFETAVGRLLLVDRETILISTVQNGAQKEFGVFGRGFGNGLVVIARRLMATGLLPSEDPGES